MKCWPLVFALVLLGGCMDKPLRGSAVDPPKPLDAVPVVAHDGTRISWGAGKPTFVFFGYTHCPDVCPATLADWARVRQQLGDRAGDVQFLFVSVDTERDTPEVAQKYARNFDSAIVGVAPDSVSLTAMQRLLGATSYRERATAHGYHVAHSPQTFLIDGEGRLVAFYSFGSGWDVMLHDVETLL